MALIDEILVPGSEIDKAALAEYLAARETVALELPDTNTPEQNSAAIAAALTSLSAGGALDAPAGLFLISEEIKLPSNVWLRGQGIGATTFKLSDDADQDQNVITNANNDRTDDNPGNSNIIISDLSVDGNKARLGAGYSTGDSTSGCGIGFAYVTNGHVMRVASLHAPKHGFDFGGTIYPYAGDTDDDYPAGSSTRCSASYCYAEDAGDDCFTGHFSSYDLICCVAVAPNGSLVSDNSNCYEIDEGSFDCNIIGCHGIGGADTDTGIEIKGHTDTPAARRINVSDCIMEGCTENYVARHIGHHSSPDPVSPNAYDLNFSNIVSRDARSHAFVVEAYTNVNISGLTCIGQGAADPVTDAAIIVYNNAQNTKWTNVEVRDFPNADFGVRITGTARSNHKIDQINITNAGKSRGISVGSNTTDISIDDYNIVAPSVVTGTDFGIIITDSLVTSRTRLGNGRISGYTNAMSLGGVTFSVERAFQVMPTLSWYTGDILHLDASGHLIVGNNATVTMDGVTPAFQLQKASGAGVLGVTRYTANTGGAGLVTGKSRNNTLGSHTIVNSGDTLFLIDATGSNGSAFDPAGYIRLKSGGTPGASADMPGEFTVELSPDGSATPAVCFDLQQNGDPFFPKHTTTANSANAVIDSSTGKLQRSTSLAEWKHEVRAVTEDEIDALLLLAPVAYKSLCPGDDVDQEWYGIIADDAVQHLPKLGATFEGALAGFQYERMTVVELAAIQRQAQQIADLTARIAALEAAATH